MKNERRGDRLDTNGQDPRFGSALEIFWRNDEKQSLLVSRPMKDIRVPKWIIKLFHMVNSANNYTLGE